MLTFHSLFCRNIGILIYPIIPSKYLYFLFKYFFSFNLAIIVLLATYEDTCHFNFYQRLFILKEAISQRKLLLPLIILLSLSCASLYLFSIFNLLQSKSLIYERFFFHNFVAIIYGILVIIAINFISFSIIKFFKQLGDHKYNIFSSIQFNSEQFHSVQFNSVQFTSVHFNSVQFNSVQYIQFSSFSSVHFHYRRILVPFFVVVLKGPYESVFANFLPVRVSFLYRPGANFRWPILFVSSKLLFFFYPF